MATAWFETVAEAQRRAQKRLPKSVYGAFRRFRKGTFDARQSGFV
jgi:hypothetical protein